MTQKNPSLVLFQNYHKTCFKNDEPTAWSPQLIQRLKNTNNSISRVVDLLIDSILGGFIIEFAMDTTVYYNEPEQIFFKGL